MTVEFLILAAILIAISELRDWRSSRKLRATTSEIGRLRRKVDSLSGAIAGLAPKVGVLATEIDESRAVMQSVDSQLASLVKDFEVRLRRHHDESPADYVGGL